MSVLLSFPFDYPFIAYFLKKNYSLRQNTLKILRVWERSLTSVLIGVYLGLIEVGTWLGTGSAKEHWRFAEKGRPDAAPDSGFQRPVNLQEVNRSTKEWPDAETVFFLCLVRRWSCVWSSEEDEYRIDRTLVASSQGRPDASSHDLRGFGPLCCRPDSGWQRPVVATRASG